MAEPIISGPRALTFERAHELLRLDASTGGLFWKALPGRRKPPRERAGSPTKNGYVQIKIDQKFHLAHRVVWLMVHGALPEEDVDHINGRRSDNRPENLRLVDNSGNQQNLRSARSSNRSSRLLGVSWHKHNLKWEARIKLHGKSRFLGLFDDPETAHQAYLQAKRQIHPACTI